MAAEVTVARHGPQGVQIFVDGRPSLTENQSVDFSAAICTTIATLFGTAREDSAPAGKPFAAVPPGLDANDLAQSVQHYLRQLSVGANAAAASLFCGSILAGHTSEADEFGDIAFWLGDGDYGAGHEAAILDLLGLNNVISEGGEIQDVKLSPDTGLPSTVSLSSGENAEVQRLQELLSCLKEIRVFCAQGAGDVEVYVLIGHYEDAERSGWAGLLGVSIET
ncbi:hypothetical protein C8Q78DRAFT_1009138 [Trametes maxima]|nr:hypothetical protein C8Q78DRAFT_1009138 [Trametes maxima]